MFNGDAVSNVSFGYVVLHTRSFLSVLIFYGKRGGLSRLTIVRWGMITVSFPTVYKVLSLQDFLSAYENGEA